MLLSKLYYMDYGGNVHKVQSVHDNSKVESKYDDLNFFVVSRQHLGSSNFKITLSVMHPSEE